MQLIIGQRQAGEQGVFIENEIGDGAALEQIDLLQPTDLLRALEQEKQLCRQRMAARVIIETCEKGIGIRIFQQQVGGLKQIDLFEGGTVADFILDKDPLFASLTLSDDELHLYQQIYSHLMPQAPTPDLVIYLQASAEKLVERVHKRSVAYERNITEQYLVRLADAYSRFFYHFSAAPLLIVNSDHLNFVDDAGDFDLLLRRITEMRGPREFFSRGE